MKKTKIEPNVANRTIFVKDNYDILSGLNSASVDLIYLDPPFNSNRNYQAPIGSTAEGGAFKDIFGEDDLKDEQVGLLAETHPKLTSFLQSLKIVSSKSNYCYLTYMAIRLIEMHRVLKPTGSIWLHCDATMSHYLKVVMDAIFGEKNYMNHIHWHYYNKIRSARHRYADATDALLFYAKDQRVVKFNKQVKQLETPKKYLARESVDGVLKNKKDANGKTFYITKDTENMDNVWRIPMLQHANKEFTKYPTQKPLALLDLIIKTSSDEGDVVLDPFCGCATSSVSAEMLGRQWIGIDISIKAHILVKKRLQDTIDGNLFSTHKGKVPEVILCKEAPIRTDLGPTIRYNHPENKHKLYGQQEGACNGCKTHFEFRNLAVDHIKPKAKGGTDHFKNLQLLCPSCNSIKGDRDMAYLGKELKTKGYI